MSNRITRRDALRFGSVGAGLAAIGAPAGLVGTLGVVAPGAALGAAGDDPSTPLGRLKIAARDAVPLTRTYDPLVVTQSSAQNTADPISATVLYPPPRGSNRVTFDEADRSAPDDDAILATAKGTL